MSEPHRLLEETKMYIKVDGSYEDNLITALIVAGEGYLRRSGVLEPEPGEGEEQSEDRELYDLAIMMFANDNYANRLQISFDTQQSEKVNYGLQQIILMLKDFSVPEEGNTNA